MSDLISRQAAIDVLETDAEMLKRVLDDTDIVGSERDKFAWGLGLIESCIDDMKELPSAQQWIPCSERLPEIGEHYVSEPCIVYCSNGAYGFAELEENLFGQVGCNCERDDEYHEPLGEVLAWMPMPEPYNGENDERE